MFKEVTQEEFFNYLKSDPRDIMPKLDDPTFTTWETKNREIIGKSYPGWKNPMDPKKYMLKEGVLK